MIFKAISIPFGLKWVGKIFYITKYSGTTNTNLWLGKKTDCYFLLVIIFVFDPLAISLVIAANFAFSQIKKKEPPLEEKIKDMKKVVEAYDDLEDEIREWEEASLMDLTDDLEWDEYGNPSPVTEEKSNQTGVPVMVDPKTGKFFYEEPEPEVKVVMSGEPSLKNLDLDGDGVIEEEEINEVFDKADTNDDGIIDEEEAKAANLSIDQTQELNELKSSLEALETLNQNNNYDFQWKKDKVAEEIQKIKEKLLSKFNKNNDDTITYF